MDSAPVKVASVQFTIPGRPTSWQRAREFVHRGSGKIVRSNPPEMAEQQKAIRWLCKAAMRSQPQLVGALRLEVLCVYAIPPSWPTWKQKAARLGKMWKVTVPDHDNLVKQISDALNGHAYADDAQIVQDSFGKRYGTPERTEVRLVQLEVLHDHSPKTAFLNALEAASGEALLIAAPHVPCNTLKQGRD